jgi:hypothetical protein
MKLLLLLLSSKIPLDNPDLTSPSLAVYEIHIRETSMFTDSAKGGTKNKQIE